jgi:HEAT repeat protein
MYLNSFDHKSKAPHIRSQCINALGHIHTKEACDTLAQIVWESVHSGEHILEPELALRNLQPFMSVDREDWLLDLLGTKRLERHDLRRAIETLGLAGTSKSLPLLRTYLESSDPHQQYISFWAIHEIYRREGVIWFNGEERCSGEELVS